jgi:AcrR family transcriptional regulator
MKPVRPKRRVRDPDGTRGKLLAAGFAEIHRHGFQAASLETILERAGVTKGALYHHFPDKAALGYAIVDEVVRNPILEVYLAPLRAATGDPLAALQGVIRRRADDFVAGGIELGCPLNNLAQEMSPLDEKFRRRVRATLDAWTEGFADALERARAAGTVRREVDPAAVATFLVAAIEGSFGLAKNARSVGVLRSNLELLAQLLDGLRPQPLSGRSARSARPDR